MEKLRKLKGFTLIELLVVIAIIGILATIVIINILGAQRNARLNSGLSNMNEALKVAAGCIASDGTITNPMTLAPGNTYNKNAGNICTGGDGTIQATWPALPTNYDARVIVTSGAITAVRLCASTADGDNASCPPTGGTSDVYSCTTASCAKK